MPKLLSCHMQGSQQGRHTGWILWPGFTIAQLDDGSTRYLSEKEPLLPTLQARGVDTADFEAGVKAAELKNAYPPKPESAELYQHGWGWQRPTALHAWSWSTTFGRWSRLVTFADGWHGYSYPKPENI